jgi:hypothetical protein
VIDITAAGNIIAVCYRGRERQVIPILELPLPDPTPAGWGGSRRIVDGPVGAGSRSSRL